MVKNDFPKRNAPFWSNGLFFFSSSSYYLFICTKCVHIGDYYRTQHRRRCFRTITQYYYATGMYLCYTWKFRPIDDDDVENYCTVWEHVYKASALNGYVIIILRIWLWYTTKFTTYYYIINAKRVGNFDYK